MDWCCSRAAAGVPEEPTGTAANCRRDGDVEAEVGTSDLDVSLPTANWCHSVLFPELCCLPDSLSPLFLSTTALPELPNSPVLHPLASSLANDVKPIFGAG
jgi:hypothetical protein